MGIVRKVVKKKIVTIQNAYFEKIKSQDFTAFTMYIVSKKMVYFIYSLLLLLLFSL